MSFKITLKSLLAETRKMITHSPPKLSYFKEDVCRLVCQSYSKLETLERYKYVQELSNMHEYSKDKIHNLLSKDTTSDALRIRRMYTMKESLQPRYREFFINLGRIPDGIKLLVDLRSDIIDIQQSSTKGQDMGLRLIHSDYSRDFQMPHTASQISLASLHKDESSVESENADNEMKDLLFNLSTPEMLSNLFVLNAELKDLITVWFSGGICQLERVTWDSSCRLLEKISELEAVHPVKGWADIKRRVGPYRRCYVFTHLCMPNEPVVILHTALCPDIPSSIREIVSRRISKSTHDEVELEDPSKIQSAIFYSISSPCKGLNGIDLGNTLIKRVVHQLKFEFHSLNQFSTLSPLPGFRKWLSGEIQNCLSQEVNSRILGNDLKDSNTLCRILSEKEIGILSAHYRTSTIKDLLTMIDIQLESISLNYGSSNNLMILEDKISNDYSVLSWFLKITAAKYLCQEKYRGYALDSVCNFHLKNGASLWRINWLADPTPRGIQNSYGVMVNYRYFIEDAEKTSGTYLDTKVIQMSDDVRNLLDGVTLPSMN